MVSFDDVLQKIENGFDKEGRTLMIAGETEQVWIFRGTFIMDDEYNTSIIVNKADGLMRFANSLYDDDIFKEAKLIIDNR